MFIFFSPSSTNLWVLKSLKEFAVGCCSFSPWSRPAGSNQTESVSSPFHSTPINHSQRLSAASLVWWMWHIVEIPRGSGTVLNSFKYVTSSLAKRAVGHRDCQEGDKRIYFTVCENSVLDVILNCCHFLRQHWETWTVRCNSESGLYHTATLAMTLFSVEKQHKR